ncbi:MAG: ABC transporter ATP-binding protein [Alphaproteobacteria bacterium]|nr:ABC transporter ATP-binding protein [Alphaproteobacteria bacterium]
MLFLAMLLGGLLEMGGIGLILPFLQAIVQPEKLIQLSGKIGMAEFLAEIEPPALIVGLALVLFAFYFVKNVYLYLLNRYSLFVTFQAEEAMKLRLLGAYLALPYAERLTYNTAQFSRTIIHSTHVVCKGSLNAMLILAMEGILALAAVSVLLLAAPVGGLASGILLLALMAGLYLPLRRKLANGGHEANQQQAKIFLWLNQSFGAVKETILLKREAFFLDRFGHETGRLAQIMARNQSMMQLPRFIAELVVLGAILAYLASSVVVNPQGLEDALPILGVIAAAALRLLPSATRIVTQLNTIRHGSSALTAVSDDIGKLPSRAKIASGGEGDKVTFQFRIQLEGVGFRYPATSDNALSDIEFSITRGEAVALVGPSGSGKTTLADIVLGLLSPSAGRILVDGKDIQGDLNGWQDKLGYVPQHIYLLDDTVFRNVAFALRDEEIDPELVRTALAKVRLLEYFEGLPDGLETRLGEHGSRLSGGQRQRIGIARALYHNPDLLVFDEATSALDSGTERDVIEAIDALRGTMTMIVIAHRMSTVRHCDRIVVLDKGRIELIGTYDELQAASPLFQNLTQQPAA